MPNIAAYAATSPKSPVAPFRIDRRDPGPKDLVLEVLFCGVCHSDLHQVRDEWGGAAFPIVPGHEIVGRVSKVGAEVKKLAVGDIGAVGCFVDSCGVCAQCRAHREPFCEKGVAFTYNSTEMDRKTPTYGGYSTQIVVREPYVLKVPKGMDLARTAPLLCAGITTYSPLKQWGVQAGQKVAVLGLGGLGHMGVKLAVSLGAEVTVLSSSRSKEADAKRLGATDFEVTHEAAAKLANRFDLILDTVSAAHDYDATLAMLKPLGTLVLVGAPPKPAPLSAFSLINGNKRFVGSNIGGIAETQEMLDYCAAKGVLADVEVIPVQKIESAYERMLKGDVRYRFVVDAESLRG